MKRRLRWGEGIILFAALVLLSALSCVIWLNRQPRTASVAPVHSVSVEALERAATININEASAAELEELPGIGPVLAAAIVEYRETHGPFGSVEELTQVYGIGEGKLAQMRPYLRLD